MSERNGILNALFDEEELPQLQAQVGKCFVYATGNEMLHLTDFDVDEGYRVEEYSLQKEKGKVIRFVHAIYWKAWYPFYDIKTASPIGHGYTETTPKLYAAFVKRALATAESI